MHKFPLLLLLSVVVFPHFCIFKPTFASSLKIPYQFFQPVWCNLLYSPTVYTGSFSFFFNHDNNKQQQQQQHQQQQQYTIRLFDDTTCALLWHEPYLRTSKWSIWKQAEHYCGIFFFFFRRERPWKRTSQRTPDHSPVHGVSNKDTRRDAGCCSFQIRKLRKHASYC